MEPHCEQSDRSHISLGITGTPDNDSLERVYCRQGAKVRKQNSKHLRSSERTDPVEKRHMPARRVLFKYTEAATGEDIP